MIPNSLNAIPSNLDSEAVKEEIQKVIPYNADPVRHGDGLPIREINMEEKIGDNSNKPLIVQKKSFIKRWAARILDGLRTKG